MATIPKTLRACALYVDGTGYLGRANSLTLPKLTIKTEEHRAGGMDAPIELDMGLEKLEASFEMADMSATLMGHFGLFGGEVGITARGAASDGTGTDTVIAEMRGRFKEVDLGDWKPGDKSATKVSAALSYYRLTVAGVEVYEIDVINMVRKIGGVDQLADFRAALGM
ncbi:phage major tail tube protein (plasmid) [Tistrella mobilis]|uniref:phage major tail tube protein n=1 Tax=Tistrella mobilis TaxID=171437 RepID=UPI0035566E80